MNSYLYGYCAEAGRVAEGALLSAVFGIACRVVDLKSVS